MTFETARRMRFIDFEASSLAANSWPIEVGISRVGTTGEVETWSSLVRPSAAWPVEGWSEASARVHNIARGDLETATAAHRVAREVVHRLKDCIVLSDAPEFDQRWLDRLLDLDGQAGAVMLRDFDGAAFGVFSGLALDRLYEKLERLPAPHRAGPDAERMARAWAHGLRSALPG